jgi:predicted ATP-binding protein involved in virulence
MKIRKLHIKNYKVFNDLELDFTDANGKTLDKIVLAGVNGCGKTTILELIKKMYDGTFFDNSNINDKTSIELELDLSNSELEQSQTTLFKNETYVNLGYTKQGVHDNRLYWFFLSNKTNRFLNQLFYLPVSAEKELSKGISRTINIDSSKKQMKVMAIKSVKDEIFKNKDMTPRQSIAKGIKEINDILDGMSLTSKLVDLESEELIFESVNGERIKFEDLSNGEKTLYFRAIYLSKLAPKDSIIMVDEPEDSLHPTWQQKIMKLYQRLGKNNQVIVATHSPHIIGASNAEEVFLLEIDENQVEAVHPRYTKGHSIDYILEVMGANPRETTVINKVDAYLALIRKGKQETAEGFKLKAEIDALNLDPNSEEMRRLDLSLRRFKAIGV